MNFIDVTQLPFNKLIGLQSISPDSEFLVNLPDKEIYTNHLGTVHASAMLAVAEAGSGAFLAQQFAGYSGALPVVRRVEAKFHKPGVGKIAARCKATSENVDQWRNDLATRNRVLLPLPIEVVDANGTVVMSATIEWIMTLDIHRL